MARRIRVRKDFHGSSLMEADESLESSGWNASAPAPLGFGHRRGGGGEVGRAGFEPAKA